MAYRLKRVFAGRFVVVTDEDEQVFGPDTHAAASAWVEQQTGVPRAAAPSAPKDEAPTPQQLRDWDRKLNEQLRVPLTEEEGELRAVLLKRRDGDTVELILREMRPLLLAGKEVGRRERPRYLHSAPRPA